MRAAIGAALAAVLMLGAGSAQAQATTGGALLELCERPAGSVDGVECFRFVEGAVSAYRALHRAGAVSPALICNPQVDYNRVLRVVVRYLRRNRIRWNEPAAELVLVALALRWPCHESTRREL